MEKKKTFVCPGCSKGCSITLSNKDGKEKIVGNKCSKGKKHVLDITKSKSKKKKKKKKKK